MVTLNFFEVGGSPNWLFQQLQWKIIFRWDHSKLTQSRYAVPVSGSTMQKFFACKCLPLQATTWQAVS